MPHLVSPMIHVPDVRATVEWYERLGFRVLETFGDGGDGLSFGILTFGDGRVMFNQGGYASDAARREVDLYVYTDDLVQHHERIRALGSGFGALHCSGPYCAETPDPTAMWMHWSSSIPIGRPSTILLVSHSFSRIYSNAALRSLRRSS